MKAILVALALCVSTAAYGMLPPKEYDKPYTGKLTVHYISKFRAWFTCYGSIACAYSYGNACTIYLPNWIKGQCAAVIRRHEIGHCNGWHANHPGGRSSGC